MSQNFHTDEWMDGWMDGWMDKGKSKCPPLKWGHKNDTKYTPVYMFGINYLTLLYRYSKYWIHNSQDVELRLQALISCLIKNK